MKKLLKKSILTFAALLAVSSAMAISAFAAVTVDSITTDVVKDEAGKATSVKVTVTGAEADEQITVLLLAPDKDGNFNDTNVQQDDIKYINQDGAATLTGTDVGVTYTIALPENPADKYLLKVGGEKVAAGIPKEIVLNGGDEGNWLIGDVNKDGYIQAKDATAVLEYVVDEESILELKDSDGGLVPLEVADVNKDAFVQAKDATAILEWVVAEDGDPEKTFARSDVKDNKVTPREGSAYASK